MLERLLGNFAEAVMLALPVMAIVGLATLVAVARRRHLGRRRLRMLGAGILSATLVLIAATTLLPVVTEGPASVNLDPGATIRNYLEFGDDLLSGRNIGLNVALFVPFGLGLALWRRWGVFRVLPFGFAVSVLIEAAQYALPIGRAVDVDDVVLNTIGAALGAVTVSVIRRLVPPRVPERSGDEAWVS